MKTLKNSLWAVLILLFTSNINAQSSKKELSLLHLPEVYISEGIDLMFISPEPIEFVDLSTKDLVGDLPTKNIARVKIKERNKKSKKEYKLHLANGQRSCGVITIVGQSFMAQYRTVYKEIRNGNPITNVQIQPQHMQPLEFPKMKLSYTELMRFSMDIYKQRKSERHPLRREKEMKLKLQLNNVYVCGDYIFLDISMFNNSNLSYDVEGIKFTIEDKKIYKATNNQTITIKPIYTLFDIKNFRVRYRNVFVFKKFTFPNGKILKIRFIENPISGRTIELKIKYSDILGADVL